MILINESGIEIYAGWASEKHGFPADFTLEK